MYRFVDRDMIMRFRGGGVGHKATRDCIDDHPITPDGDEDDNLVDGGEAPNRRKGTVGRKGRVKGCEERDDTRMEGLGEGIDDEEVEDDKEGDSNHQENTDRLSRSYIGLIPSYLVGKTE
jgi:hypothetical protein